MPIARAADRRDLFHRRFEGGGRNDGCASSGKTGARPFVGSVVYHICGNFTPHLLMIMAESILKFSNVTIETSRRYETGLWKCALDLHPGDLWLVRIERE